MLLLFSISLLLLGCGPARHRAVNSDVIDEVQQSRSELDQAYDMLARVDEFERGPAMITVASHLSNHLNEQQPIKDWQPDKLVGRLPRALRSLPPLTNLGTMQSETTDALYLEEALLMRSIGSWVTKQTPPPAFSAWLKTTPLDEESARDLTSAQLLFDWTVRNIQLDELLEAPKDVAGPTGAGAGGPASLRGLPGPGYLATPWYTAMTGHGDAWQRARIFILLARQQEIDVVMLALPDAKEENKNTPWACGVLLNDQLYLFDPALGLPIAGPDGKGVATLAQVREDGQLLRGMDVDAEHLYEVSSEQVKSVVALIDASLDALSQRMLIFERGLAGDRRLVLYVNASALADKVRKTPGITSVALWPVGIDASFFELAYRESPGFHPELRQSMFEERLLFEQRTQVSQARYKHLRGQFSDTNEDEGAKGLYVTARVPNELIDSIDTDTDLQRGLGLTEELKRRKNPQERAAFLDSIKNRMRRGTQDCSYWLGLTHYETGNYDTAVTWWLKSAKEDWWTNGAHYNLGRAYEHLEAFQLAQEQYLAVEGPAQLGALLRAKRLAGKE